MTPNLIPPQASISKMWSSVQLLEQRYGVSSLLLPLSFTILTFSFIIFFKRSPLSNNKKTMPPSPSRFPIIGNLHQIGLYPHRSLQSLAQIHGPIMLLHFGSTPVLVISSSEMAKEIMKTHDIIFANRPKSRIGGKLLYQGKDIANSPYGEYWRQMKSVCVLHLLSNKRVQSFRNVREEETTCMIKRVEKCCSDCLPVNLSEVFASLTNDVVCRVALGRKYSKERKFKELLEEFAMYLGFVDIGDYIPWLSWINLVNGLYSKVEKVAKELDSFLDGVVEEHRDAKDGEDANNKDFVDVLLWIQKENMAGFCMDTTSVKALILDVFAAGTDTTYTVLEWAMTELLRHPEKMKKVQNELRSEMANKESKVITEDDISKFDYLKAIIKETLRLHPPIPLLVPRMSTQDVRIKGFDLAAGTQVIINSWAIGRDPALWDRPEEFWPERFLKNRIDFRGQDFELIPFGAGRRICPGIQFAMSTDELALANLLYKFDWALHGLERGEDLDVAECTGLTIHRKFPLLAVATPYS